MFGSPQPIEVRGVIGKSGFDVGKTWDLVLMVWGFGPTDKFAVNGVAGSLQEKYPGLCAAPFAGHGLGTCSGADRPQIEN